MCKGLASYASTVNPFSLELVYNSSYAMKYGEENYDVAGGQQGLGMHLGAGVHLNVMQRVEKVELQSDIEPDQKKTYLKYTDGDGQPTISPRMRRKKDGLYYDEDGLGLKIDEYLPNYYRMTDDKNNALVFVNGHLLHMEDANGI